MAGRVVSTAGDGHFLVFSDATAAARWSIAIVQSHIDDPLDTTRGTKAQVRISMHLGTPQIDPRDETQLHWQSGRLCRTIERLRSVRPNTDLTRSPCDCRRTAGLNGVEFHAHGKRDLKGIGNVEVHELLFDSRSPQPTRHTPARRTSAWDWTAHTGTVTYSKLAGLLPDGSVPTSTTVAKPMRLGNYELGDLVGAGGMGDVFKAKHAQFGRQRAVKVIKATFSGPLVRTKIVRRFYQEIKAIGGLETSETSLFAIDSSSPDDQTHFLVMEYVDGKSAGELIERFGPMSVANATEIARQTLLGLDCNRAGKAWWHRDIKPSNLMVHGDGYSASFDHDA